ncbi:hypothetical protein MASR2M78_04000 [Treponema sp.]
MSSVLPETSVAGELDRLSTAVKKSTGKQKHGLLIEMARLYELAGNVEAAVSSWTDAAFSESERDDNSLLEAARCLVALGETEKAYADVHTVLLTGRDARALAYARYLGAQIGIFRGDENAEEILASFIDNPEYADKRPSVLYLLYLASGKEDYRTRLLSEHPLSPEAYALAFQAKSSGTPVSLSRSALWLFFPLRGAPVSSALISQEKQPELMATEGEKEQRAQGANEKASALQIGLYRGLENAQEMVKRLESKGFKAEVSSRLVDTEKYWVVTVPLASKVRDIDLILRLKDAGFESFPIFPY